MDWRLNKEQIAEVSAMFTKLCEEITDKEISLNLSVRKDKAKNGKALFTYSAYAIFKDKLIYIKMGNYCSLMKSPITNVDIPEIMALLKGDK